MKFWRQLSFGAAFSVFLILPAEHALAAPATDCTVSGMIQGGGGLAGETVSGLEAFLGSAAHSWSSVFGEAVADLTCGNWVFQLDGADYYHAANMIGDGTRVHTNEGHIGGAVFWRDTQVGALGVASSVILSANDSKEGAAYAEAIFGGSLWRVGGFGEYFAGDNLTFGIGANYINGSWSAQSYASHVGVEADAYAKFYATDNLSLTLRGDILASTVTFNTGSLSWNGFAISSQAEYLVPGSALSLYGGGRFADRTSVSNNAAQYQDVQGFVGLKLALGGAFYNTLRDRDRNGAYDNTSVFDEKLPNEEAEYSNLFFTKNGF